MNLFQTDKKMHNSLSQYDVLARLYSPSSNLSQPPGKKAMVVVSKGVEHAATHTEMESLTLSALSHLKIHGITAGDNVVFCCENRLEFSATLLACWALNATASLIDYRTDPTEVFAVCKKLKAKLLFTSLSTSDLALSNDTDSKSPVKVMVVAELSSSKARTSESSLDFRNLDMDRPLLALFTSGTTGAPKTAVHNLRSLIQNVIDLAQSVDLEEGLTAVTPLPVSHIFGLTVLLVTQVLGMKTVLTTLDPVTFIKAVHYHKPHLLAALPQFYGALLNAPPGVIDLKDTKLLLCGGAPLTVSLAQKFEETFGKRLNNGYGSTESKIFALNQDGPVLSVGKAMGKVEIDIIDTKGVPVSAGKFGEVRITSSTLMDGYLNDDEKTKKVMSDGQYFTGDYGRLEDGYLFVAGRKDDIVTVGGVVVYAAEVEAALRNYLEVKDVAVTAVSNKRLGQIVKASVVLMDEKHGVGLNSTNQAERHDTRHALVRHFRAYCAEHLTRHKRPMLWDFLGPHDDLPKTLAGKVDKKALK
ncbi:MAG: class I adenylate-forming enzyme family protein [Candidatus Obscuribacterales bacterium]|nr:class I adenylate-forming enzyme family protein [Candidatus Obscuribacterales bacterium]